MHFWTEDPVLFVEEAGMRNIDPRNPENLFGMWSVFSKASGILENGQRLEYMSWRLWQQQTLCPKDKRKARLSATLSRQQHPRVVASAPPRTRLPELSSSVESDSSVESSAIGKEFAPDTDDQAHSPPPQHCVHESMCCVSNSGITPDDLQNLVLSIKVKQDLNGPFSPLPTAAQRRVHPNADFAREATPTPGSSSARPINVESSASTIESSTTTDSTYLSPTNASETSVGSDSSQHSVVRGFEPGRGISTYRSQSQLAQSPTPILKPSSIQTRSILPKRTKGGVFDLGPSSGEDENSLRDHMTSNPKSMSVHTVGEPSYSSKKQISFVEQVAEAPKKKFMFADDDDGAAVESESEDDSQEDEEVSESAIDDDDAWEDEGDAEEPSRQLLFHRVESKPDLVSRRSLLTDNLHESSRAAALQTAAARANPSLRRSRTSTPNGPSMPASPTEDSPIKLQRAMDSGKLVDEEPAANPGVPAIRTTTNMHPPCPPMSPRATRRNMVSQELGMSLRKHMLNERQFKNLYSNNNSPLRRAHTSTDVRTLDESREPGPVYPMSTRRGNPSSNDDFDHDLSDYHRKGW